MSSKKFILISKFFKKKLNQKKLKKFKHSIKKYINFDFNKILKNLIGYLIILLIFLKNFKFFKNHL